MVLNFSCVLLATIGTSAIALPVCLVPAQSALAMARKRVAQFLMMAVSLASVCQDIQVDTAIVLVSEYVFCDSELLFSMSHPIITINKIYLLMHVPFGPQQLSYVHVVLLYYENYPLNLKFRFYFSFLSYKHTSSLFFNFYMSILTVSLKF